VAQRGPDRRRERDLIEAGLNESAGRLCAVARLWGLFEVVTLDRLAAGRKRRMDTCALAIIEGTVSFERSGAR